MRYCLIFIACLLLTNCHTMTVSRESGNTNNLSGLQRLSAPLPKVTTTKSSKKIVTEMRRESLKDIAMTVGAQSALHWRTQQIDQLLTQKSKLLDRAYNFNLLLLDHHILPPVLAEGQKTLKLDGPNTIRLADRTYQITSQAKFTTTSPTWRDYLWMDYPKPAIPDAGILPHNFAEENLWRRYVREGWQKGLTQANEIFSENLSRLTRDYKGMILYRQLHQQNIVSAPFVAATSLGVTGGGERLDVNDQVLRITALPALQSNSSRWKAVIVPQS